MTSALKHLRRRSKRSQNLKSKQKAKERTRLGRRRPPRKRRRTRRRKRREATMHHASKTIVS